MWIIMRGCQHSCCHRAGSGDHLDVLLVKSGGRIAHEPLKLLTSDLFQEPAVLVLRFLRPSRWTAGHASSCSARLRGSRFELAHLVFINTQYGYLCGPAGANI